MIEFHFSWNDKMLNWHTPSKIIVIQMGNCQTTIGDLTNTHAHTHTKTWFNGLIGNLPPNYVLKQISIKFKETVSYRPCSQITMQTGWNQGQKEFLKNTSLKILNHTGK